MPRRKRPMSHAERGRLGGLAAAGAGGHALAERMSPEERSEAARRAVIARWAALSAEERSERARALARARWGDRPRKRRRRKPAAQD